MQDFLRIWVCVMDANGVHRFDVKVQTWDEFECFLENRITTRFLLIEGGSREPFTKDGFEARMSSLDKSRKDVIVHAMVEGSEVSRPNDGIGEARVEMPCPGPPANVRCSVQSGRVRLSWEPPQGRVQSYRVLHNGTTIETTACHIDIDVVLPDVSRAISVSAKGHGGFGPEVTRYYFVERQGTDFAPLQALLHDGCKAFTAARGHTKMRILLVGKQHHGKSSLTNHLVRCLKKVMDIGDEVETGPPSEMETTVDTKCINAQFGAFSFSVYDTPAFSSLTKEKAAMLQQLLEMPVAGWRRGDITKAKLSAFHAQPPDAVIVVVSLIAWRDEHDDVQEYLKKLQDILKHATRNDVAVPFVLVATHKDAFQEEAGNHGKDPVKELKAAKTDLKALANTEKVFAIQNYKDDSEWIASTTSETYRALRDLTSLAKNVDTSKINWLSNQQVIYLIVAMIVAIFALVIKVSCSKK